MSHLNWHLDMWLYILGIYTLHANLLHTCDIIEKISLQFSADSLFMSCIRSTKSMPLLYKKNNSQSNFFAALCNIFAIFRPFCDIIADIWLIAAYYKQLCNIMQHCMPIKLSPQKRSFTTIRRRNCGDISPRITYCCILVYKFVT